MPGEIRSWDFLSEMDRIRSEAENLVVKRPVEMTLESTVFSSERSFELFWGLPREATLRVLREAFPELALKKGYATSRIINTPARPNELFTVVNAHDDTHRHLIVMEKKVPNKVVFDTSRSIVEIMHADEPVASDPIKLEAAKNVWRTMIQTYTYMVLNRIRYGLFSNWDNWAFMERRIIDSKEVLFVSPWMGRDCARLGWSTLVVLACRTMDSIECSSRGSIFGQVPAWVRQGKRQNTSGATAPPAPVREAYPETTTEQAMGVTALCLVEPYQVLGDSRASHTRRLRVNGMDLVAKFVDFLGAPSHCTDITNRDLWDWEWNEVRTYHYLREHQGRLVPRFIYHGCDLNQIWVTAVTTNEGESLAALLKGGLLTTEIQAAARASLIELHSLGVIHGDVALRNAIWRPSDGRVLWIDFEQSTLRTDFAQAQNFDRMAERELGELNELVAPIQPLAESVPVATDAKKNDDDVDRVEAVEKGDANTLDKVAGEPDSKRSKMS